MLKKKFWIRLLGIIVILNLGLWLTGYQYIYKAVYYNFVDIDDYKIFDNNTIHASSTPQPWIVSPNINNTPLSDKLTLAHDSLQSIAFLVIKNDSIVQEHYWKG